MFKTKTVTAGLTSRCIRTYVLLVAVLAIALGSMSSSAWAAPPDMPPGLEDKLMDQAITHGSVRVIVGLKLPGRPFGLEGRLPDQAAVGQQRANIAHAANALRGEMLPFQARINREYVTLPYMALSVNANALEHLLNSPRIISIEEDQAREPLNASSTPFVGADSTWEAGFGGKGASVAILDTGVDNDHPFFLGGGVDGEILRIVDEACFSTPGDASLCPNSDPEYGPGSADPTVANCFNASGDNICTHGTHVAGIAAGQDDPLDLSNNYDGIAPEAGIVSVQVFHRVNDCDDDEDGDQPCVRTWDSDYNAGLDWVQWFALPRHNVASANMSLGGGVYNAPCGGTSTDVAIASLRSVGVATAVAAGNDGWTWLIGGPGCAPNAVTVGAVSDSDLGSGDPWEQTIWPYDVWYNMSKDVDIVASGLDVDSSEPDDVYGTKSGTSMATPQVAGAFAVLKAIDPSMSVDDAEQLLEDTGFLVMDQRDANPVQGDDDYDEVCGGNEDQPECQPYTRIVKPLLQLNAAVAAITESDLGIYKDCKPDGDKLLGQEALCFLTITNHGDDAAMEVEVTDTYISDGSADFTLGTPTIDPADAGSCEVSDNPQNPSGSVTCDLGGMLAGEVVDITIPVNTDDPLNIDNNATVTALTPDPFLLNNASSDGLVFYEDADLAVTKDCKPDGDLLAGDNGICTIIVQNFGPSDAVNVEVVDTHISNEIFTIDAFSPGLECWQNPSNVVRCLFPTIAAGDTETIEVHIQESEPMDINDTVTVTSDTLDSNTDNNTASDGLHIVGLADLYISKSDIPDPVVAGTPLTYQLTVGNLGPSHAENVVVSDIVPAGTETIGASVIAGAGSCVLGVPGDADRPTECGLGTIAPGAVAIVDIQARVLPDTTGVITNDAKVSSDTLDSNNSNNFFYNQTTILVVANMVLEKFDDQDPVAAGAELKYLVRLTNDGPSTATDVLVVDHLPQETSLVKFKVLGGTDNCLHSSADPDIVTCTVGSMNPGDQFVVAITVLVDPSYPGGTITNQVVATGNGFDPIIATEETTVSAIADLWIDKTGSYITQNPGKNIIYTLTVHNDSGCSGDDPQVCGDGGPSDAQNVTVLDTLPSTNKKLVVTFVSEDCVYNEPSHTVTCVTPTLAVGDSVVHLIEATPKGNLRQIENVAEVSSTTFDPNAGNNEDRQWLVVGGGGQKGTGD